MSSASRVGRRGVLAIGWKLPILGLIVILVVAGLVARARFAGSNAAVPKTVPVKSGAITASVSGIGTVAAVQAVDLTSPTGGTVTQVLVKLGDTVTQNQPLVRLDDRVLQSQVVSAQADLNSAEAKAAQAKSGNATPQDLAAAQAQVALAQANYNKLLVGPSAADVASAEAGLKNAQAHQKNVLAGPTASDLATAQADVVSAQAQLASAQKTLADLKAQPKPEDVKSAQLAVEQAKDQLWSQQTSRDATCGASGSNSGVCQSANASVSAAETAVNTAVVKLQQTQQPATAQDLASAQQGVQSGQAGLTSALAKQTLVKAGPTAADRQAAQTQVDQAKASLDKLNEPAAPEDLKAAQASIDQARANLQKLTAPASASDQAIQQDAVIQAEQALKQAQINLDNATIQAPFAGVITAVNVVPGSLAATGPVVSLLDRSELHVDLKLSENDVVKVALGQPVTLTSDSLPNWSAKGTVTYISPTAAVTNGVSTYAVRVSFAGTDPKLRVGMNANVSITTAHKNDVLLVPNTALLPKGAGHAVQRLNADGKTVSEVDVQTGLSDGTMTEIISGLKKGDQVVALPSLTPTQAPGGPFGG